MYYLYFLIIFSLLHKFYDDLLKLFVHIVSYEIATGFYSIFLSRGNKQRVVVILLFSRIPIRIYIIHIHGFFGLILTRGTSLHTGHTYRII